MNTRSILLAYATRYGSTQEVAETITAALRQAGLEVDIQPMQAVKTLDNYDAVVLGAARRNSRRQLDKELQQYPWLKPIAVEIFAGKYDPSKPGLGFFDRLLPARDHRNWDAIRAWANALPVNHMQIHLSKRDSA